MSLPAYYTDIFKQGHDLVPRLHDRVERLRELLKNSSKTYRSTPESYAARPVYSGSSAVTREGGCDSVEITGLRSEIDTLARKLFPIRQRVLSVVPDQAHDLDSIVSGISEREQREKILQPTAEEYEKWKTLGDKIETVLASVREVMGAAWGGAGVVSKSSWSAAFSLTERKPTTPAYLLQGTMESLFQPQYALPPNPRMAAGGSMLGREQDLAEKLEQEFSQVPVEAQYVPRNVYARPYSPYRS